MFSVKKKLLLKIYRVFWFSLQLLSGTFLIPRIIQQGTITNVHMFPYKVSVILPILIKQNVIMYWKWDLFVYILILRCVSISKKAYLFLNIILYARICMWSICYIFVIIYYIGMDEVLLVLQFRRMENFRTYYWLSVLQQDGKYHAITCHEGTEGQHRYGATPFNLGDRWGWVVTPRPGRFTPGNDPVLTV